MNARTVRSTTGMAPITFTRVPGGVRVDLEDGSAQVYPLADLAAAVLAVTANHGAVDHGWDEPCGYWPTGLSVGAATNRA